MFLLETHVPAVRSSTVTLLSTMGKYKLTPAFFLFLFCTTLTPHRPNTQNVMYTVAFRHAFAGYCYRPVITRIFFLIYIKSVGVVLGFVHPKTDLFSDSVFVFLCHLKLHNLILITGFHFVHLLFGINVMLNYLRNAY